MRFKKFKKRTTKMTQTPNPNSEIKLNKNDKAKAWLKQQIKEHEEQTKAAETKPVHFNFDEINEVFTQREQAKQKECKAQETPAYEEPLGKP